MAEDRNLEVTQTAPNSKVASCRSALGFIGSYGRFAAFARDWRADRQREQQTTGCGMFVLLSSRPSEAFQFDWSEDYALAVSGRSRRSRISSYRTVAHFWSGPICCRCLRCCLTPIGTACVCSAACLGRGIYDNMRRRSIALAAARSDRSTSGSAPEFCNPAADWENRQVEKNVQDSRPGLWQQMPEFPDLATLNLWLEQHCQDLWQETPHGCLPGSIADGLG